MLPVAETAPDVLASLVPPIESSVVGTSPPVVPSKPVVGSGNVDACPVEPIVVGSLLVGAGGAADARLGAATGASEGEGQQRQGDEAAIHRAHHKEGPAAAGDPAM